MTASMHMPKTDYGFRCGSFLETDVVDNKYSFTIDLPMDLAGERTVRVFAIGKGPNHMTEGWESEDSPLDIILFHGLFYISRNSSSGNEPRITASGIVEIKSNNTKLDRPFERITSRTTMRASVEGNNKIRIDLLFYDWKTYSRENYEYRYFVWSRPNTSTGRNALIKTESSESVASENANAISNNLFPKIGYPFGHQISITGTKDSSISNIDFTDDGSNSSFYIPRSLKINKLVKTDGYFPDDEDFVSIIFDSSNNTNVGSFYLMGPWFNSPINRYSNYNFYRFSGVLTNGLTFTFRTYLKYGDGPALLHYAFGDSRTQVNLEMFFGIFEEA